MGADQGELVLVFEIVRFNSEAISSRQETIEICYWILVSPGFTNSIVVAYAMRSMPQAHRIFEDDDSWEYNEILRSDASDSNSRNRSSY